MREMNPFDYDYENDSLFIYNPNSKSKGSVELDDLIIDYNANQEISSVELLNASQFFNFGSSLNREKLTDLADCKLEVIPKHNFVVLRFLLIFTNKEILTTPKYCPEASPLIPIQITSKSGGQVIADQIITLRELETSQPISHALSAEKKFTITLDNVTESCS